MPLSVCTYHPVLCWKPSLRFRDLRPPTGRLSISRVGGYLTLGGSQYPSLGSRSATTRSPDRQSSAWRGRSRGQTLNPVFSPPLHTQMDEWNPGFPLSIDAKCHKDLPRDIQFDSVERSGLCSELLQSVSENLEWLGPEAGLPFPPLMGGSGLRGQLC